MLHRSALLLRAHASKAHLCTLSGPPLAPLPQGSFFSFLRDHGRWASVAEQPSITCYSSGRTLTYADLERRISSAAHALAATGFTRGSVLNIHLPNCEQTVVAFLAATELGGVVMPSNPIYTASELAHLQSDSGATIIISTRELGDAVTDACATSGVRQIQYIEDEDCFANALMTVMAVGFKLSFRCWDLAFVYCFISCGSQDVELPALEPPIDAHDLLALPYSSGTTGLPKGVMLSHQNLIANVLQVGQRCGGVGLVNVSGNDRVHSIGKARSATQCKSNT